MVLYITSIKTLHFNELFNVENKYYIYKYFKQYNTDDILNKLYKYTSFVILNMW